MIPCLGASLLNGVSLSCKLLWVWVTHFRFRWYWRLEVPLFAQNSACLLCHFAKRVQSTFRVVVLCIRALLFPNRLLSNWACQDVVTALWCWSALKGKSMFNVWPNGYVFGRKGWICIYLCFYCCQVPWMHFMKKDAVNRLWLYYFVVVLNKFKVKHDGWVKFILLCTFDLI